jgi:hypothetical protein
MPTDWNNIGPRVGVAWDPVGDGKTSVRASYGKSFEFVDGQFHLNTSVAPPWGSEVRLNAPPGGLDNPFLGSPGGQTNIFPVTFDKNAPFSLNGPFLSLTNDLDATNVQLFNVTVERQFAARWFATAGYIGSRTHDIWESTPLNNALLIPVAGTAPSVANTNARRPLTLLDPNNGRYYGPLDKYVSDGTQSYNGMVLAIRGGIRSATVNANYTLSHCYGSPDGGGSSTPNLSTGYNIPSDPHFDDGNCTVDRLHNFSMTASVQSPELRHALLRAAFSDWRLVGGFRKTRRRAEWTGHDAASESGARQSICGPIDQSAQRRHAIPESRGIRAAGVWHAGQQQAQRHSRNGHAQSRSVADADRPRGHDARIRTARRRVQRAELAAVESAGDGAEQSGQLRPDHDGRSTADHAVRDQVSVLIRSSPVLHVTEGSMCADALRSCAQCAISPCRRSVTRGPSRASDADQGLATCALRGRAASVRRH